MSSFAYRLNPLYPIKECSSCGALYTTDYCYSVGDLGDKIICDLDKITDFSQQSPQNCPKCGNPVKGHYCQGCAVLRQTFKEDLFASAIKHGIIQDSSEPSNDNPNVVNAPREPFIVNQDPDKNSSQSPPQINHHCCYGCGDLLEGIICHQCTCKLCGNGAHYGYNYPPKVLIIPDRNLSTIKPLRSSYQLCKVLIPNLILFINLLTFSTHLRKFLLFLVNSAGTMLVMVTIVYLKFRLSIRNRVTIKTLIFRKNFKSFNNKIFVVKIAGLLMKLTSILACYDDDDDYNFTITPNKPDNSLSMGDEHLDTILATESDEFIKSSVENLVPIPSESEGESEGESEYAPEKIFSNPLFEEEITLMKIDQHHHNVESDLIESPHTHDSSLIISLKIDSLIDEFADELALLKSIPPRIDETDCDFEEDIRLIKKLLYNNSSPRPSEEFVSANSDTETESFSLSPIPVEDSDSFMEEIDLSFTPDYPMPPGIEEDGYESKRDILILKDLPSNDTLSIPEIESFHFDIPSFSRPPAKPPDGDTGILNVKMMGDISDQKSHMHKLMITLFQIRRNLLISYLIGASKLFSLPINAR
nr:hypothetical protein [Tanacetum cinerariifolium]